MTIDLIVGILTVSAQRTVTIRRTGRLVGVLELLVGDETRAGFGVTFWVDVAQEESQFQAEAVRDELRECLEQLRKGDVVLMRNIALSEFQKVVRGNSLGRTRRGGGGRGGNATGIKLLWRAGWMREVMRGDGRGVDEEDAEVVYESDDLEDEESGIEVRGVEKVIKDKTKRVKEWTRRFIPAAGISPRQKTGKKRRHDVDMSPAYDAAKKRAKTKSHGEEDNTTMTRGLIAQEELPPDDSLM